MVYLFVLGEKQFLAPSKMSPVSGHFTTITTSDFSANKANFVRLKTQVAGERSPGGAGED